MLPTQLIPDDNEGKILRVRLIQKEGVKYFSPVYLFDEGSTVSWIPCGRKLTCSYPGIKFFYGPQTYYGHEVLSALEFLNNLFSILFNFILKSLYINLVIVKFYYQFFPSFFKIFRLKSFKGDTDFLHGHVSIRINYPVGMLRK